MKQLTYLGYRIRYPMIYFRYFFKSREYREIICLENILYRDFTILDKVQRDVILHHIGLAIIPTLYNIEFFTYIKIKPFRLSKEGEDFFANLLDKGLRELKYKYRLPVDYKPFIEYGCEYELQKLDITLKEKALVLHGGGKDSAVAGELINYLKCDFDWLAFQPTKDVKKMIEHSPSDNYVNISKKTNEIIKKKYPGHRPYSSLLFFLALLPAAIYKYKYIVTGNEYTADFPNTWIDNKSINHQYAKSHEFENDFLMYVHRFIFPNVKLFSILRPFYEVDIMKIFTKYPKYYPYVKSCNRFRSKGEWCGVCPKCVFIYLLFSVYLYPDEMLNVFGKPLHMNPEYDAMLNYFIKGKLKPFECIGTKEEIAYCIKKSKVELIRFKYEKSVQGFNTSKLELNNSFVSRNHNIPDHFWNKLVNHPELAVEKYILKS